MTEGRNNMEHGPEETAVEAEVTSSEEAPPSEEVEIQPARTEVETVQQELDKAREEAAANLDDARRIKAEFENYRKRMLKEQTSLVEGASLALIEQLLPVLDDFELALLAADHAKDDNFVRGVEMVYGSLLDVLRRQGLEKIDAAGKPFDPSQHEAMMEIPGGSPDGDPSVAEVVRSGYTLKGRVIRPARVTVIRK
jgi:molecular chaperone GrpE